MIFSLLKNVDPALTNQYFINKITEPLFKKIFESPKTTKFIFISRQTEILQEKNREKNSVIDSEDELEEEQKYNYLMINLK